MMSLEKYANFEVKCNSIFLLRSTYNYVHQLRSTLDFYGAGCLYSPRSQLICSMVILFCSVDLIVLSRTVGYFFLLLPSLPLPSFPCILTHYQSILFFFFLSFLGYTPLLMLLQVPGYFLSSSSGCTSSF